MSPDSVTLLMSAPSSDSTVTLDDALTSLHSLECELQPLVWHSREQKHAQRQPVHIFAGEPRSQASFRSLARRHLRVFSLGPLRNSYPHSGFAGFGRKIPERQPQFRENPRPGLAVLRSRVSSACFLSCTGVAEIRAALGLEQGLRVCLRF